MGAGALSVAIDDFNADNFDHTGLGFIGGGSISAGQSGARPIQSLSTPPGTPAFGTRLEGGDPPELQARRQRRLPGRVACLPVPLPRPRPELPGQVRPPLIRITFDWEPNERAMIAYAGRRHSRSFSRWHPTRPLPARSRRRTARLGRPGVAARALRHGRRTSRRTTRAARSWAPTRGRPSSTATCRCGTPRTCSSSAPATSRRTQGSTRREPSARSPTGRPRGSSNTTRRGGSLV